MEYKLNIFVSAILLLTQRATGKQKRIPNKMNKEFSVKILNVRTDHIGEDVKPNIALIFRKATCIDGD